MYLCSAMKNQNKVKEYGLIGYPLDHAFSKTYFEKKFVDENLDDCRYHLFPISEIQRLPRLLKSHPNLLGLNVTTPYKELVIPYLDDLDPVALSIGAVNTITIMPVDGKLILKGYNTDVSGMEKMFEGIELPKKALVFGSGGSSRAVRHALKLKGVRCLTVSRDPMYDDQITYEEVNKEVLMSHKLIINCTPVGMYPKTNAKHKIPYNFIGEDHIAMDLIYNPEKTEFLQACEAQGAMVKNGFTMLTEQADKAWSIWERAYKQLKMVSSSL
jgi:shikimate dehydrogenase